MGRGRAKAKQTKVARELKYSSPQTDFQRLQRELSGTGTTDWTATARRTTTRGTMRTTGGASTTELPPARCRFGSHRRGVDLIRPG